MSSSGEEPFQYSIVLITAPDLMDDGSFCAKTKVYRLDEELGPDGNIRLVLNYYPNSNKVCRMPQDKYHEIAQLHHELVSQCVAQADI